MTLASDRMILPRTPGWARYMNQRMPGETPHIDDQFFPDRPPVAASSGTAVTPTGTAVWLAGYSTLSVAATNQSSGDQPAYLFPITSAAAPKTIETRLRLFSRRDSNPMCGLVFSNGTAVTSNIASVGPYTLDSGAVSNIAGWTGTFTNASTNNIITDAPANLPHSPIYVRLIWVSANTFAWAMSYDGVTWSDFGTSTQAATLTPTHFGVFASSWGQAYTVPVRFDYFRVYDADLSV